MFGRHRHERDMEREFAFHLEREALEHPGPGATRHAVWAFGGEEKWKESSREQRRGATVELWLREIRLAWRALWPRPGFALTAILILALGIGASTAMFSVVYAVLLHPLPFPRAGQIVYVWSGDQRHPGSQSVISYPNFLDLRRLPGFAGMAAFTRQDMTLTGRSEPVHLAAEAVSASLFSVLGARPAAGRTFLPGEDRQGILGGANAVILSYALAVRDFAAPASAVGQPLTLDSMAYRVVGVMPAGFQFPLDSHQDLWTTIAPLTVSAEGLPLTAQRSADWMYAVARLRPGVNVAGATARLEAAASRLRQRYPRDDADMTFHAQGLLAASTGASQATLWLLLAAVGCLWLIACINLAGLLLSRQARRRPEFALRWALGAGSAALVRQLGCESLLLGSLGAAAGVLLAALALAVLLPLAPGHIVRLQQARLDGWVLAFAAVAALLTSFLIGLAPALELGRAQFGLRAALASGARGSLGAPRRLRRGLVGAQFALALVVLLGALLVLASLRRLTAAPSGYDSQAVLTATLSLPDARYPTAAAEGAFFRRVMTQLRQQPAIEAASASFSTPLGQSQVSTDLLDAAHRKLGNTAINIVTPGYFQLLRVPMLSGREFAQGDDHALPQVAIVNQAFVRRFGDGQPVLGRRILPEFSSYPGDTPVRQIVGVVADMRQRTLRQADVPTVYVPAQQLPVDTMQLLLRPRRGADAAAVRQLRQTVHGLDAGLPVYALQPLSTFRQSALAPARFASSLLGAFAVLALFLAAVGLYGVMAQGVEERRRDMALRMALGANRGAVAGAVRREGVRLAAAGLAAGLAAAVLMAALLRHLLSAELYATSALNPGPMLMAAGVLLAVAWLACALPARRAAAADPASVLRSD